MTIRLYSNTLSPLAELADYQAHGRVGEADIGASAIFIGTMRDYNDGDDVLGMTLEHYPGMTEKELERISNDAQTKWPIKDILIGHRVGEIAPGDAIVLVAVWTSHRAAAFEACRFIMEELKSRAPFWKQERLIDRRRWVAQNTAGYTKNDPL